MSKHREILNKILGDLIANLELDQVEQLQKTIIAMTAANNAKVTRAFVKFESEMPSETCEKIDFSKVEVPGLGITYAQMSDDFKNVDYRSVADVPFNKTELATSTPRISDAWSAKHAADRILARCLAETFVDDGFRKEMRTAQFVNLNSQFGKFGNRYTDKINISYTPSPTGGRSPMIPVLKFDELNLSEHEFLIPTRKQSKES